MKIKDKNYRTIWSDENQAIVHIIDQTKLPHAFEIVQVSSLPAMVHAIKVMQVRGAPLIGVAAAYGIALAMHADASDAHLHDAAQKLKASRPTAVNLQWAVSRMVAGLQSMPLEDRAKWAWTAVQNMADEDAEQNLHIGQHGLSLIQSRYRKKTFQILTHCNAGWLATVDYGTALAPIYAAHDAGLDVHVWVGETRPRNQGASLTAWELSAHGVPHTVVADNAVGYLMQQGLVDMVIVGADRVTALGDVCNKIGTYLRALAAHDNHIPFYVAVPTPTIDWTISHAAQIEIEHRHGDELAIMQGVNAAGELQHVRILPADALTLNPAFDVTPANLVTGIITERGVFSPAELKRIYSEK
ncbi:MAG TPA: S-methyl-5-thioribose-1-phosphate isomerase [Methylotenera sp.]|nr:S-methyl-5-thioribose-1-phosphate isomerase [Methylotenera sp.]HPH04246.1 S-methyl-5-thioribose-1-phosphate isomerase [Methylotenera sp.]HPM99800.1 S-methyl-5-thioribose-1-phosphate isomerase [Methylotenera sp.]